MGKDFNWHLPVCAKRVHAVRCRPDRIPQFPNTRFHPKIIYQRQWNECA